MKTIVCGRWNRHSSSRDEARKLWSARNRRVTGRAFAMEVVGGIDALTRVLVRELDESGIDFLGDGGFNWDSVFDVAKVLTGARDFFQLTRIPNTNHFHRQWTQDNLKCSFRPGELYISWDSDVRKLTSKPLVACLPGPYSMARQTRNMEAHGLGPLTLAYARALRGGIATLLEQGATLVRIEDPQILDHPEDWRIFKRACAELMRGIDQSKVILATWYGDVTELSGYFNLPFGNFWLDFVEGEKNLDALAKFPKNKKLIAGLFDARQTYEEPDEEVGFKLAKSLEYLDENQVILGMNTDLHFLPWDSALEKVRNLVRFAGRWTNDRGFRTLMGVKGFYKPRSFVVDNSWRKTIVAPSAELSRALFGSIAYPTSSVGSFPQPDELRRARVALRKGTLEREVYGDVVRKYIRAWMQLQTELGTTLPVTGEFGREDMAAVFGQNFGGRLLDFVPSYENRRYRPVEYPRVLRRMRPIARDDFEFGQSLTAQPLKETVTGPATLADWGLIRDLWYYRDRRSFRMDFARALREEIEDLVNAGVRVLQVDEPALTAKMQYFPWDIEAIYETVRGLQDKIYLILHLCYSDMESLDQAFPHILKLPFHQIHIEMANRNYAPVRLIEKYGFAGKDIGLGVLDVHTDRVETVEEVVRGVSRVRKYFEPHQIWLTPDCGLKERSEKVANAKLHVMAEAAKVCRATLV